MLCLFFFPSLRLLRLQGLCPARIQPHREDMGFPLGLTAAVCEKSTLLHSCISLRPGNAAFCSSQTNPGTPPLCIQLLLFNLMQNDLLIYQPETGTLLSQSRAALLQPAWLPSIPSQHWP